MGAVTKPDLPNTTRTGYCNPPEHTRFKRGKSGNPRGRPQGTLNIATVLARTLRAKVVVNENGKRKKITKLEAAIQQLTDKATSGDLKALQLLTGLVRFAEDHTVQTVIRDDTLDEVDEKVVLGILKRLELTEKGDQENANESDAQ
jgi:hypothetical protein